jgi:nucleolin
MRAAPVNPDAEGSDTLFCGNVSFEAGENDIRQLFETIGEVRDIRMACHEDGTSKGFAHIQFVDPAAAKEALTLNG